MNDDEQDQFSQELQLSGMSFGDRLNWLLGAYYFEEDAVEHGKANLAIGTFAALRVADFAARHDVVRFAGTRIRGRLPLVRRRLRFGGARSTPNNIGVDVGVDLFTRVANESDGVVRSGHVTSSRTR